jgi:hypothetical protein
VDSASLVFFGGDSNRRIDTILTGQPCS